MENDIPRMVKTPWYPEEIPFIEAAETGYIALNRDSIYDLDVKLLSMIKEVQSMQNKKVASAVNACH